MSNRFISYGKDSTLSDAELEALGQNALKERETLLEKYPYLKDFQKNIDRMIPLKGGMLSPLHADWLTK